MLLSLWELPLWKPVQEFKKVKIWKFEQFIKIWEKKKENPMALAQECIS